LEGGDVLAAGVPAVAVGLGMDHDHAGVQAHGDLDGRDKP